MFENADTNNSPSQNDEYNNSSADYLHRAAQASAAGDAVLGMHLYLAAFERAAHTSAVPDDAALDGLRKAWNLACTLKERSLAEYIFEKIEPYLAADEIAAFADQLQRLALDKLEEFGLTREDLEDMTDMISQDFLGVGASARLMKVEHVTLPRSQEGQAPVAVQDGRSAESLQEVSHVAAVDGSAQDAVEKDESERHVDDAMSEDESIIPALVAPTAETVNAEDSEADDPDTHAVVSSLERITYHDIVGYSDVIATMRDFGMGMQEDLQFQDLVSLLNARHGLDRMPAADVLLFRSPAREDANRFMVATLGELGLPAIRMHMEENIQGMPVLCVMAQADNQPKLNAARNAFEGAGVLILEDIDLWIAPMADMGDDMGGFMFASLSRGAREAINLIRSAVENPDVFVLVSSSDTSDIDAFFYDLLEPLSVVDIDYPTPAERADIWAEIARDHPSLRAINRADLVRYSVGMPRYDIYMAAREAVEDAYKANLVARRYMPVTKDNLFEKLAAYQPLDSDEYRALEDAIVEDFRRDLEHLDDLLKGTEE